MDDQYSGQKDAYGQAWANELQRQRDAARLAEKQARFEESMQRPAASAAAPRSGQTTRPGRARSRSVDRRRASPAAAKASVALVVMLGLGIAIAAYGNLALATLGLKRPTYSAILPDLSGQTTQIKAGWKTLTLHQDPKRGLTALYRAPHRMSAAPDWARVETAVRAELAAQGAPDGPLPALRLLVYRPELARSSPIVAEEIALAADTLNGPMAGSWGGGTPKVLKALDAFAKKQPQVKLVTCYYLKDGRNKRLQFYFHSDWDKAKTYVRDMKQFRARKEPVAYPYSVAPLKDVIGARDSCPGSMRRER